MTPSKPIRVLIVDDSAIVRKILSDSLAGEAGIEVVGTAPDPYVARDKIISLRPDVLTLDVEMPRMDGLTFLKKLMKAHPMPVIMISSLTQSSSAAAIEALAEGAVDVIAKPSGPYSVGEFRGSLAGKIRAAAACKQRLSARTTSGTAPPSPTAPRAAAGMRHAVRTSAVPLIAIGASTGGTEAIERILAFLPPTMPPIVVVQHIPAGFSLAFANRLNKICASHIHEAVHGDLLSPGTVLVAPGDLHMRVMRAGTIPGSNLTGLQVSIVTGPPVCYQRPSVDVLFESVADLGLDGVLALILTGMGSDGAQGMLHLRGRGAHTIAQDEATCAVFGMPKETIRLGASCEVLPLPRMAQRIIDFVNARPVPQAL